MTFSFATTDLESSINSLSTQTVLAASVLLLILVFAAMWTVKKKKKKLKAPIFILMLLTIVGTTLTISGATVYLNMRSASGGPVHWHADIEFWACGNELDLRNPTGFLSNKIGTPTLHEHNDKRIHLEGVPVELPHDASLGKFMEVVGGGISTNTLIVPLNDNKYFETAKGEEDGDGHGAPSPELIEPFVKTVKNGKVASFVNGQSCGDQPSEVQVFAYKLNEKEKTYSQTKLTNPAEYAIAQKSEVPPGDCIIFEFGPASARTDKLCKQYGVRDKAKCERFGVSGNGRKICELTEVR